MAVHLAPDLVLNRHRHLGSGGAITNKLDSVRLAPQSEPVRPQVNAPHHADTSRV